MKRRTFFRILTLGLLLSNSMYAAESPTEPVKGGLKPQDVQTVVRKNLNQVAYCHDEEIKKTPGLKGKLSMQMKISADGSVQSVKAASNESIPAGMEACIAKKISRWKFPVAPSGEATETTYPFSFTPNK